MAVAISVCFRTITKRKEYVGLTSTMSITLHVLILYMPNQLVSFNYWMKNQGELWWISPH